MQNPSCAEKLRRRGIFLSKSVGFFFWWFFFFFVCCCYMDFLQGEDGGWVCGLFFGFCSVCFFFFL